MKKTAPRPAVVQVAPAIPGRPAPSVMTKVTRASSSGLPENAVCNAGPGDATAATVVATASLRRSNLEFFLRSIAENPRPK
jgi:hypothetical protein